MNISDCSTTYSHIVPNSATKTSGPIRRTATGVAPSLAVLSNESNSQLLQTMYENFRAAAALYANAPYLGHRPIKDDGTALPYVWQSYQQVLHRVDRFAAGLIHLGLCPEFEDSELGNRGVLGIFSINRPEWVIAEQACFCHSIITVPMYDTISSDTFTLLANQIKGLKTILCSLQTARIAITAKPKCSNLQTIIIMPRNSKPGDYPGLSNLQSSAQKLGLQILTFDEVEKSGKSNSTKPPHTPPSPSDIFTFCYTSGTTGEPKGALITHGNIISNLAAISAHLFPLTTTDVHLSYLPLPHMMERTIQATLTLGGGSIGFYQGDPLKLLDDLQTLRPTVFSSVPRVLNRIKDRVTQQVKATGGFKERLFNTALNYKLSQLRQLSNDAPGKSQPHYRPHTGPRHEDEYAETLEALKHTLFDTLVFNGVKSKLGFDRLRGVITGSAPITRECLEWLRAVLGVPVMEGYGMTECTLVATIQSINDLSVNNVGGPIAGVEIKLQDVPDMKYLSTDTWHGSASKAASEGNRSSSSVPCCGRGEILLRGPSIFKGYYHQPSKTADMISADGWLHTGDIGLWTRSGQLKIIDRKKNIFKLAQGEYVAPEKVEGVLSQEPLVLQSFVYGDSTKDFLVAVIVVNPDNLLPWAIKAGLLNQGEKISKAFLQKPEVNKAVIMDIQSRCMHAKLFGFEIPKAIYLELSPWTQADLLTPTFKLKRNDAEKFYAQIIQDLYASVNNQSKL